MIRPVCSSSRRRATTLRLAQRDQDRTCCGGPESAGALLVRFSRRQRAVMASQLCRWRRSYSEAAHDHRRCDCHRVLAWNRHQRHRHHQGHAEDSYGRCSGRAHWSCPRGAVGATPVSCGAQLVADHPAETVGPWTVERMGERDDEFPARNFEEDRTQGL